MSQENPSVLKFIPRHPPESGERRIHSRHLSPQIIVTFLGADHEPMNWSLGGFLIADRHPHCPIATTAEGFLSIRGRSGRYPFKIELIRRDDKAGQIAFRFVGPSPALMDILASIDG